MKQAIGVFLACISVAVAVQARCTTLPDACGDDKTQFDVKTQKNPPAPAPPAEGKAQIVFLEQVDATEMGGCLGCNTFATRLGMDGSWVGAAKGGSYFSLDIAPGEHHLCANWKSIRATRGKNVGVMSLNADAGKVYYFQVTITDREGAVSGAPHGAVSSVTTWVLDLSQLSEDEGKYRVKVSALATATARE
jgi:hypothetical protein